MAYEKTYKNGVIDGIRQERQRCIDILKSVLSKIESQQAPCVVCGGSGHGQTDINSAVGVRIAITKLSEKSGDKG